MRPCIKVQARIIRFLALALMWPYARGPAAQPPVLELGARMGDCTSALRVGLQSCVAAAGAADPSHRPTTVTTVNEDKTLEARVDAYLANFGKPPRAAVRALLEPSDENIRAFVTDQENTLSLAAYVAARMTALRSRAAPTGGQTPAGRFQFQAFGQARVRLFQRPGDTSTEPLMRAMAELSQLMPGVQVGVQVVGPVDALELKREISRIDPLLSVEVAPPEQVRDQALPLLRLDDLELGISRDFEATHLSAIQLGQALLSLRNARQGRPDAEMPEGPR